jgi:uncharacterized protein
VVHHLQNELCILPTVDQARRASSATEANALTVRLELMADCLSGVWARNVEELLERGGLEEALNAARMIGNDHMQRQAERVPIRIACQPRGHVGSMWALTPVT